METSGDLMQPTAVSNKARWTGRILSGFAVLFLAFDGAIKVINIPAVVQSSKQLGYPPAVMPAIGIVLLVCIVLYAIPGTAVLGAILLTGYLGGAVATHVRMGNPLVSHILFPVYAGVLIWGGLYLRDGRLRELIPLER